MQTSASTPSTSKVNRSATIAAAFRAAVGVAAVVGQAAVEGIRAEEEAIPGVACRRCGGEEKPQVDGKKIMEKIATQTGGRYFEAKKRENLEEIYGVIAEELRGQYLLTYTPDMVDNDGGYHKVALKANNGDLSVQTREGYYAPGGDASR